MQRLYFIYTTTTALHTYTWGLENYEDQTKYTSNAVIGTSDDMMFPTPTRWQFLRLMHLSIRAQQEASKRRISVVIGVESRPPRNRAVTRTNGRPSSPTTFHLLLSQVHLRCRLCSHRESLRVPQTIIVGTSSVFWTTFRAVFLTI